MTKIDLTQSFIVTEAERASLSERALPKAPDGHYTSEARAEGEADGLGEEHSRLYDIVNSVQEAIRRGPPVSDPKAVLGLWDKLTSPNALDDRKGFFTDTLSGITRLPAGALQDKLNDEAMALLYDTLPHPPATFLGNAHVWRTADDAAATETSPVVAAGTLIGTNPAWRNADGSGNNTLLPQLGQSGTPYARSVQGKHPLPANMLPDPGLVFDTLLKARDFQPHPGRNSSLTFAFASLVTHSLFRTDPKDWNKNNTTSYLDLSPLYGFNQVTQDQVRDRAQGRGLLYPDTFSEDRLFFVPPAASALLVIFSRNHNYVANMLLKINERGRWADPPPADAKARAQQDEEIFQTARLVNCGHFMALIFGDYVAGFLGLGREGNAWSMNPFDPITTGKGAIIPRGQGNHVSVEFNVLYRWHATTAQEDIKWTEDEFNGIFKGKPLDEVQYDDFKNAAKELFHSKIEPDPRKRNIEGIKRQEDGTFNDDDLARILHDATEKTAGAYRARGTPAALRVIEIMGMEQARRWGVCTMNEFRTFLGLKPFADFEDWSTVPGIAEAARRLYNHIDNLELYPGLQAEDCMDLGPGSGICCGYTMTRAILADAIALVRGDRFYTTDYSPANLTSWGYQDCARDPNNGAFGAALPKLLVRHLPRHYPTGNVYGLFPFFTPTVTKVNLTKLKVDDQYTFERPVAIPVPKALNTLTGIRHVFANPQKFSYTTEFDSKPLKDNSMPTPESDESTKGGVDRSLVWNALSLNGQRTQWFKEKTTQMIRQKSITYDGVRGRYVDVVKNVINLVFTHWAADNLCGLTLKTVENPSGLYTEQEVSDMLAVLYACVSGNLEPEQCWSMRNAAQQLAKILNGLTENRLMEVSPFTASNPLKGVYASIKSKLLSNPPRGCDELLISLAASGHSISDIVASILSLAVDSSVYYAQAAAQVIDFYLDKSRVAERTKLIACCARDDQASAELLRGYVREGMRLNPPAGAPFRKVEQGDRIPQGEGYEPLVVNKGDLIYASVKNAHLNPADFPNPTLVDPTRPKKSYQLQPPGPGVDFAEDTIPEIVKTIFRLPGVRRAPGSAGICASFELEKLGSENKKYVTSSGITSPWPGPLFIVYDG